MLLIRHAKVPAQDRIGLRREMPLSEEGRAQALALAERMRRYELSAIFSSPLRRTMETAEAIAAAQGIAVTPEASLIEVNPGSWDNRTFAELHEERAWKDYNRFRSGTRIPGGEMMIEVQARVVTFLESISRRFEKRTVAVISHADVIRGVVCHYMGISLDLSLRVEIDPASVSVLEIEDWGARLLGLNG